MFASNTSQVSADANFIEDVFSTYLYTGNSTSGGTQTITNNINLSTKGGMVWIKGRSAASNHILTDTTRGAGASATNNNALASNLTSAEDLGGSSYDYLSSFSTTGFVVTQGGTTTATRGTNYNAVTYASWTFREQAKFFDVVTYTGNNVDDRQIAHSLGSTPGCVIVKNLSATNDWMVWHRSLGTTGGAYYNLRLNTTAATVADNMLRGASATTFTVSNDVQVNGTSSNQYVAYLFAHDAGGFGLTGTDNVISCGSFTTNGSGNATVSLGYEPQWVLVKRTNTTEEWQIIDNMRPWPVTPAAGNYAKKLVPNSSAAEADTGEFPLTNTGFSATGIGASNTYIYIAIRRGPMKTPTSGTSVYTASNAGSGVQFTAGFPPDMVLSNDRTGSSTANGSRLIGPSLYLETNTTAAETSRANSFFWNDPTNKFTNDIQSFSWVFRRAPGFFDVVCYSGSGSTQNISHNLAVVPELIIFKARNSAQSWPVYSATLGTGERVFLNGNGAAGSTTLWPSAPTSSVFSVEGGDVLVNANTVNYVAYLFATVAGVSKVGSYTGSGTTKQIDCGFTAGARFVMIRRTDNTGDWYVWDSARGIVSGNDPYLRLNSTAAEVTNTDYVDTLNAGFEISSTAPAAINANGGTFIFLAIS